MILAGSNLRTVAARSLDPTPDDGAFGPMSVDLYPGIDEPRIIESGEHLVLPAVRHIDMPRNLAALVTGRSTHMRQGLFMPAGWIDPGFASCEESPLKLEFGNTSDGAAVLYPDEPAARLVFFELSESTGGYDGRYGE